MNDAKGSAANFEVEILVDGVWIRIARTFATEQEARDVLRVFYGDVLNSETRVTLRAEGDHRE